MMSDGALTIDVDGAHDPAGGAAVAVGGAEGAEVVVADQRGGGRADRLDVERLAHVPGAARAQRRADEVAPDGVAVDLAARREAGVEVGRRLGDVDQRHVGRERSS